MNSKGDFGPLKKNFSEDFVDRLHKLIHIVTLMTSYAEASGAIFERLQEAREPYAINDGEILLGITASRNVLRLAETGVDQLGQTGPLQDSFREYVREFKANNADLVNARNVIEHADAYIIGKGRSADDWFNTSRQYGDGSFMFKIGKRELDLMKLAESTAALSSGSMKVFEQWLVLESTFDYWKKLFSDLTARGLFARVPYNDFSEIAPLSSFALRPRKLSTLDVEVYRTKAEVDSQVGNALVVGPLT